MNLLEKFRANIQNENLFNQKDVLLIAVSGGVDSVVLCELCKQAGYDFAIAHCNFQLRGDESNRDETFVKTLAAKYSVEVLVNKFETNAFASANKMSIQVAARVLRYGWFKELINDKTSSYKYLLTAHHANDNIETLLMNFYKGTGITGLRGILPKQGNIIRPLLFAKKEELVAFAKTNDLSFVEDSSNALDKYSRNYLRNQFIPVVEKLYPQAEENLIDNLHRFRDIEILYQQSIQLHKKKLIEQKGNEIHIPVLKLKKTVPLHSVLYEILKDFGFTAKQTDDAIHLLDAESGKYILSSSHRLIKNRNWLIIAAIDTKDTGQILIEGEADVDFINGQLEIKKIVNKQTSIVNNQTVAQLDFATIQYPFLLRKWKKGDYFYPLGMTKKKKLSRFFGDLKLSLLQKEKIWVIEMNKKIIWVVGYRIDDRFKLSDQTKEILEIKLIASK